MNISLNHRLESLIQAKVESGLYNSASEVIREALRLMEERDQLRELKLEELRREIQRGIDSGDSAVLDIDSIKSRGREHLSRS